MSVTMSSSCRTWPLRRVERSGRIYSWTMGFRFRSVLAGHFSYNPQKNVIFLPTYFQVLFEVGGHVATRLFDMIHNVGLVHHVPLPK